MKFVPPSAPDISQQQFNDVTGPRSGLSLLILTDDGHTIDDSQLRIKSLQGQENISQPFQYQLELRANDYFSADEILDFATLMGANTTVMLGTPETQNDVTYGSFPEQRPVVYFNGMISNFALAERGVYHVTLKPALFKLGLQNNYRLFNQKTILEVVSEVLSDNNIKFNKAELNDTDNLIVCGLANYRRQDWLQAGESDLDFINRLMQKVHLFYYFTHSNGSHEMVITDQPYYKTIYQREVNQAGFNVETDKIKPLYLSYTQINDLDRDDYITSFKYQQNLTTNGITSVLAQTEAVWESQNTSQASPVFLERKYQKEKLNIQQMHKVQYGASKSEVEHINDTAMNKLEATRFDFSGSSTSPELKAGHKFKVLEASDSDNGKNVLPIRPELNEMEFVVTSVQHQATVEGSYTNTFSAVSASGLATAEPAQDQGQGTILARVTAKPAANAQVNVSFSDGDFNEVDHTGSSANQLEKTVFTFDSKQFLYDQDDNFDCTGVYVRFIDQPEDAASQWVKLAEHMQTVPEVGTYVIVSRSQDSTEIPEIQNIIQSKGSKVIMPDGYTTNTNVGDSYNTSYGDSTSIGMGADIGTDLERAQNIVNPIRDAGKYNNVSYNESSSYSYNISSHSHNISVTGDQTKAGYSEPYYNPGTMEGCVQYSQNNTYGDTYSQSEHIGNTTSTNTEVGATTTASTTTGAVTGVSNMNGATTQTAANIGAETFVTSKTGVLTNVTNINGMQLNTSLITGSSISTSTILGNQTSTSTVTGNNSSVSTTIGNQTGTNTMIGNTVNTNTTMGNSTSTQTMLGNSTNTNTTLGNNTNTSTTLGNSTNTSVMLGNNTNTNTTLGNSTNVGTTLGNQTSTNTTLGNTTSTGTTLGNATNTNTTLGNTTSVNTTLGNMTNSNTHLGNVTNSGVHLGNVTDNSSFIGSRTSIDTNLSGCELKTELRTSVRTKSTEVNLMSSVVTYL